MLFIVLTFAAASPASPAATLPLHGWYRPGRFIPVRLAPGETSLTGDGIVPTDAAPVPHESIVPLLIEGSPASVRCGTATLPLRAVEPGEKLVASTGDALTAGTSLFPGAVIDPIPLEESDLLPGPPAAWQALDAVVLDAAAMRRIDDTARSTLLADGVLLACPGPVPPDLAWPWKREGPRWVLRHAPAGSVGLIDDAAFAPTAVWTPHAWPAFRRTVALLGVLLMLVSVSLTLVLPTKWALPALTGLVIVTTGGLLRWRATLGTLDRAGGDLFIVDPHGFAQRDILLYQHARDDSDITLPWAGDTTPIFDSALAMDRADLRLHVDGDGSLRFTVSLARNHTSAWRRRVIARTLPSAPDPAQHDSPLRLLARADYLAPGLHIAGELPAAPGRWNGVLVSPN